MRSTVGIPVVHGGEDVKIGNSIVVPILTDGRASYWWVLLAGGIIVLLITSQKERP